MEAEREWPSRWAETRFSSRRLAREWKTVTAMIRVYCRDQHGGAMCPQCADLARYVRLRLDRCRFGGDKPTCARCPVHCYQRDRREQIRAVMRYAGPRMLWRHPWLSLWHLQDGWFRTAPPNRPHSAEPAESPHPAAGSG
jgi:hypothetical protein